MNALERFETRCRAAFRAHPAKTGALCLALREAGIEHQRLAILAGDTARAAAARRGLLAVDRAYLEAARLRRAAA